MLKEISIVNFKSIRSEVTFSMEADADRVHEHPDHLLEVGDNHLLKVTSMYGPNGGGKTNVLLAILMVKNLFFSGENMMMSPQQICCVFSEDKYVEETVFFVTDQYEIGYRFKILPTLTEKNNLNPFTGIQQRVYYGTYDILEEEVSFRKIHEEEFHRLFTRNQEGEIESESFSQIGILENLKLSKNKTVVNYVFNTFANTHAELQECLAVIRDLACEILRINELTLGNVQIDEKILGVIQLHKRQLISLLNGVDIRIKDIRLYKEGKYYPVFFVREIKSGDKAIEQEISLSEESAGTQKVFWIFVNVLRSIQSPNIFLCDDMNALLHPKLFRAIIQLFTSDENQTSQLIFNSHDLINMDKDLFRRDEIWFVYRDENYSSCAVPLSNIVNYKGEQIRKDAKYSKQYLEGKYGADPFIRKGLNWHA